MGHVRGHQLPIQNGTHNFRFSSGYENVPVWTGSEGIFQNNARNLTRKFQEGFHSTGGYNNGPASKKRRETNFSNSFNFNNGLPFARRLEDSACSSWGINNNLAFTSRREESSCNITGFTSSSALARKAEDSICNSATFDNEPVLRRVEGSNSTVGSSSEGSDHYLSREEIERCSPSRKDGIDLQKETYFRYSYCAFLQTLGMRLQLPQTTIATAVVYCHRFFLRRSHASHDRFLVATAAMFLAAKSEESPRPLNSVLIVSYEICHKNDLANFHYSLPIDWFEQYKQQVLQAEQLLLTTLDFELTVQHPYNPLMSVFNKIGLTQTVLVHVAWNLVSEGAFYWTFDMRVGVVPNQIVRYQIGQSGPFQSPNRSKTSTEEQVSTKPSRTGLYCFKPTSSDNHVLEYLWHSYNIISMIVLPSSTELSFCSFVGH